MNALGISGATVSVVLWGLEVPLVACAIAVFQLVVFSEVGHPAKVLEAVFVLSVAAESCCGVAGVGGLFEGYAAIAVFHLTNFKGVALLMVVLDPPWSFLRRWWLMSCLRWRFLRRWLR